MEGSHGACGGGSRRQFLRTAATTGAAAASAGPLSAVAADKDGLPRITLGKTGRDVTRLGMGTSWTVQPSFVQISLAQGVGYIDTAEGYENGNSEKTIGEVLEPGVLEPVAGHAGGEHGHPRAAVTGTLHGVGELADALP